MASLNLAGKTSGYVKLQAPDDSSNNPTVTLPTESGEIALKGTGGSPFTEDIIVNGHTVGRGSGNQDDNVAVGKYALLNNTTGVKNTAIGRSTGYENETGNENVSVGYGSLFANTADKNVAIGNESGRYNTTGSNNTTVGHSSGLTLTTGSNVTCIGYATQPSAPDVSNEVTIGNDDVTKTRLKGELQVSSNGHMFDINPDSIGEATSIFSGRDLRFYVANRNYASQRFSPNGRFHLGCEIDANKSGVSLSGDIVNGVTTYRPITGGGVHHFKSDNGGEGTLKSYIADTGELNIVSGFDSRTIENTKPIESALDKVNKLKPITYDYKDSESKGIGFVAHELQEVISEAVVGKKDQNKKDGTPFYQGVDITKVIPYLTKAIQELSEKDKLIEKLSERLDKLEKKLKK